MDNPHSVSPADQTTINLQNQLMQQDQQKFMQQMALKQMAMQEDQQKTENQLTLANMRQQERMQDKALQSQTENYAALNASKEWMQQNEFAQAEKMTQQAWMRSVEQQGREEKAWYRRFWTTREVELQDQTAMAKLQAQSYGNVAKLIALRAAAEGNQKQAFFGFRQLTDELQDDIEAYHARKRITTEQMQMAVSDPAMFSHTMVNYTGGTTLSIPQLLQMGEDGTVDFTGFSEAVDSLPHYTDDPSAMVWGGAWLPGMIRAFADAADLTDEGDVQDALQKRIESGTVTPRDAWTMALGGPTTIFGMFNPVGGARAMEAPTKVAAMTTLGMFVDQIANFSPDDIDGKAELMALFESFANAYVRDDDEAIQAVFKEANPDSIRTLYSILDNTDLMKKAFREQMRQERDAALTGGDMDAEAYTGEVISKMMDPVIRDLNKAKALVAAAGGIPTDEFVKASKKELEDAVGIISNPMMRAALLSKLKELGASREQARDVAGKVEDLGFKDPTEIQLELQMAGLEGERDMGDAQIAALEEQAAEAGRRREEYE